MTSLVVWGELGSCLRRERQTGKTRCAGDGRRVGCCQSVMSPWASVPPRAAPPRHEHPGRVDWAPVTRCVACWVAWPLYQQVRRGCNGGGGERGRGVSRCNAPLRCVAPGLYHRLRGRRKGNRGGRRRKGRRAPAGGVAAQAPPLTRISDKRGERGRPREGRVLPGALCVRGRWVQAGAVGVGSRAGPSTRLRAGRMEGSRLQVMPGCQMPSIVQPKRPSRRRS
jgi:hypothetical protein